MVTDQPARDWVLTQLRGQDIAAPAHQPAEVVSALARLARAGVLSVEQARVAADEAMALEQELVLPAAAHLRRALALQERVRVLDGLYVAVAEELRAPIVTTDRRLRGAGLGVEVAVPEA